MSKPQDSLPSRQQQKKKDGKWAKRKFLKTHFWISDQEIKDSILDQYQVISFLNKNLMITCQETWYKMFSDRSLMKVQQN